MLPEPAELGDRWMVKYTHATFSGVKYWAVAVVTLAMAKLKGCHTPGEPTTPIQFDQVFIVAGQL